MNFVARDRQRKSTLPTVAVVDSQSIRTGLPHSIKSVDGGKKIKGISYHRPGQSSCICVRLFRSQCNRIAPSLREHICTTLDRPSVNKYWGTGSKTISRPRGEASACLNVIFLRSRGLTLSGYALYLGHGYDDVSYVHGIPHGHNEKTLYSAAQQHKKFHIFARVRRQAVRTPDKNVLICRDMPLACGISLNISALLLQRAEGTSLRVDRHTLKI